MLLPPKFKTSQQKIKGFLTRFYFQRRVEIFLKNSAQYVFQKQKGGTLLPHKVIQPRYLEQVERMQMSLYTYSQYSDNARIIHFISLAQGMGAHLRRVFKDHSRPLFLYFRLFYKQLTVIKCSLKVPNDWIRTRVFWYRKQPLCQLRHNHCLKLLCCLIYLKN